MSLETGGGISPVSVRPHICSQFTKSPYCAVVRSRLTDKWSSQRTRIYYSLCLPFLRKIPHIFYRVFTL
jgi:hypothetical protein